MTLMKIEDAFIKIKKVLKKYSNKKMTGLITIKIQIHEGGVRHSKISIEKDL